MGDRTYVQLKLLRTHVEKAHPFLEDYGITEENVYNDPEDSQTVVFGFEKVNYGELPFLPDLEKLGIPFDSVWGSGDEYSEGYQYNRYDAQGEQVAVVLYDEDLSVPIMELETVLHDYNALADLVRERIKGIQVIPWDNQERNSKLFLTKQLINPE